MELAPKSSLVSKQFSGLRKTGNTCKDSQFAIHNYSMIEHWLYKDVKVAPSDGQRLSMWNPLCLQIVQYHYFVLTLGGRHFLDRSMDRVVIFTI